MMWMRWNRVCLLAAAASLMVGCEDAADLAKKAKSEGDKALATAKEKSAELAKEGNEMASQLGEQAMALLGPLKEKIAGLESLADKPAEMKTMVTELLATLESNMTNLPVPDAIKTGLTALKEQLTKLLEHLGGNVDATTVQGYLKTIKEIVGSQLGS